MKPAERVLQIVAMALMLAPVRAGAARALPADAVDITVVVHRVDADCEPEDSGQDFYPVIIIGEGAQAEMATFADEVIEDDNTARWRWAFTSQVDAPGETTTVSIRMRELDGGWPADALDSNDIVDIHPDGNRTSLKVTFNHTTGLWTVDEGVDGPAGDRAFGQWRIWRGDQGPDCAEVEFDIVAGTSEDQDRDGLLDNWELQGLDADGDNQVDVDLPAMGAQIDHKDIFVEADWMQEDVFSHEPLQGLWEPVWRAFDNAPVANPDGTSGIHLHVDTGSLYSVDGESDCSGVVAIGDTDCDGDGLIDIGDLGALGTGTPGGGNQVPEQEFLDIKDEEGAEDFYETKDLNFDPLRALVFHYVIFGHSLNPDLPTTTGRSEVFGNDLIVTLGSTTEVTDTTLSPITNLVVSATVRMQAGTLMHELGHNLNLNHGGWYLDNQGTSHTTNHEPNDLSVMNYDHQFGIRGLRNNAQLGLDYSIAALPSLDESSLDDCVAFGDARVNAMPRWTVGVMTTTVISVAITGPGFQVNWNNNVNGLGQPIREGQSCGNNTANYALDLNGRTDDKEDLIILRGVDDWNEAMDLRFRLSGHFDDGAPLGETHADISYEAYRHQEDTAPRVVELEAPGQFCAGAPLVGFDNLPIGTLVTTQYAGLGATVVDNDLVDPKLRADERNALTWSPPNSLFASPQHGGSSLGIPLVISFTPPVFRVGMAIGNGGTLSAPGFLRAYDAQGGLIGVVSDPIPEAVTEFLGIYALEEDIYRVELDYPIADAEEIDGLIFDACPDPLTRVDPPSDPYNVSVLAEGHDVLSAGDGQNGEVVVANLDGVSVMVNGEAKLTAYTGTLAQGQALHLVAPLWAVGPGGQLWSFHHWREDAGPRLPDGDLDVTRTPEDDIALVAVYRRAYQTYLAAVAAGGPTANLVEGHTNSHSDVFARHLGSP